MPKYLRIGGVLPSGPMHPMAIVPKKHVVFSKNMNRIKKVEVEFGVT